MKPSRVAITGFALINPYPDGKGDVFSRLMAGESATQYLRFQENLSSFSLPVVQCTAFSPDSCLGKPLASMMDRFSQLGTSAAFSAWQHAGLTRQTGTAHPDRGVAWGTSLGGINVFEQGYRNLWQYQKDRISPLGVVMGMNNAAAAHISIQLGLGNTSMTYSMACSSAAAAIGEAWQRIRAGQASIMIAGGSDATLAHGVIRAWEALRVLAPGNADSAARACRPFDRSRSGFVLAEGAAALVLENWEHAMARNATIYAELAGYGANSDASHLVKPDRQSQVRAMQLALSSGNISIDEIDYINAHGTATREGDNTEIAAIRQVFGDRSVEIAVSATKSMHGHMMGATGAMEAVITTMALVNHSLPPTAHLTDIDPNCAGVRHLTTGLHNHPVRAALSNSFAFGGHNIVLAFKTV